MANSGVTYFDVSRAADRLQAKGIRPTIDSVRVEMGNTGSKSTIAPLVKEWRENRGGATDDLPSAIAVAAAQLHKFIVSQATESLEVERVVWSEERLKLRTEKKEVQQALDDALEQLDLVTADLTAKLELSNRNIETISSQLSKSEQQNVEILRKSDKLESQVNSDKTRIEALADQLNQEREQHRHLEKSCITQRESDAVQVDRLTQELREQRELSHSRTNEFLDQQKHASTHIISLTQELAEAAESSSTYREKAATHAAELSSLGREYNMLRVQCEKLEAVVTQQRERNDAVNERFVEQGKEIVLLEQRIAVILANGESSE